ncbi:MAG: hypothetical protein NC048_00785 [Bacteroides sp.]|nr:hypothetical protein [Ruminococcus flavefaciens]MCM1554016.1 hypothetical protein [Bacteroides sp.]
MSYSPVLRSWWYDFWKPVPPLKFSLTYTYDIPMRSRFVNFYAIGEVSYIGAYYRRVFVPETVEPANGEKLKTTSNLNSVILSAGLGLKVYLVSFLDLAVFYTGGYRYTQSKFKVVGDETGMKYGKSKTDLHDFSGCTGVRLIGKINKINVFAGYSFTHMAPTQYVHKLEHYVDVGIGYTF